MELRRRIQEDLQKALKNSRKSELSVLRLLWDKILKEEKSKRANLSANIEGEAQLVEKSQLTDPEIIQLITSSIKKSRETILQFEKGQRDDLAQKEKQEIEVIKRYLPEQLSEDKIKIMAEKIIQEIKAESLKDMGKVMAALMPKIQGRAGGDLVSRIVKDLLSSQNSND